MLYHHSIEIIIIANTYTYLSLRSTCKNHDPYSCCSKYVKPTSAIELLRDNLYDTIYCKRTLSGKIYLIKKDSCFSGFFQTKFQSFCKNQTPFFHSGKCQSTLVGFHLSDEWAKNQTMAWVFIPQCSFPHKNHIMKISVWDPH